jgi:DNA-binding NarL/FixJ family response regulator
MRRGESKVACPWLRPVDPHDPPGGCEGRVRVALVLSDGLIRSAVGVLLVSATVVQVIGEASAVADALGMLTAQRADVVIVDRRATAGACARSVRELRAAVPETRVLVIGMSDDSGATCEAISAGAGDTCC